MFNIRNNFFGKFLLVFIFLSFIERVEANSNLSNFSLRLSIYQNSKDNNFLKKFYSDRNFLPIFVTENNEGKAAALIKALEASDLHGIPSKLYRLDSLKYKIKNMKSVSDLGALEVEFSERFMLYVKHMSTGVLDPELINEKLVEKASERNDFNVPRQLDLKIKKINFLDIFSEFNESNPLKFFRQLQPTSKDYLALIIEKSKLEETLKRGGWGDLVTADILLPGDEGKEVVKLRNRLIKMGLMPKSYNTLYNEELVQAVKKFQMTHGLSQDGLAGEITLREINQPISSKLKLLVASLERRRWLNREYENRYLKVNIPDFKLKIVEGGETIYESKVVVGQNLPNTRTPEFSNKMQFMIINPSWYVPKSIILEEYLPQIRNNIDAVEGLFFTDKQGNYVERGDLNLEQFNDKNFPYGMKQPPSKENALGVVKFMLPNEHNIYLHDTPHKNLFSKEIRTFSHGCVRVHEPFELAYQLLSSTFINPKVVFNNLLENESEFKLNLRENIPVHIVYSTVWSDKYGEISYRRDIYKRDDEIYGALKRLGLS